MQREQSQSEKMKNKKQTSGIATFENHQFSFTRKLLVLL